MTPLERRYRWLLLAYPRAYRAAHGRELLGVLVDCAAPGRTVPEFREAAGLVAGGLRERVRHGAGGNAWWDGLHLGVTAVLALQLATLLPYAGSIPLWVALSGVALLAVLRGYARPALPVVLLTGVKATAIASGWQPVDVTLLPVYPSFLAREPLFGTSGPVVVALGYGLAWFGLLALAFRGGTVRTRSWCWWGAVPLAAWAGPAWMPEGTPYPIGLSRLVLELALLCLGVWAARTARDPRWAVAAACYLTAVSLQLGEHLTGLTNQHLGYWGLLAFLTVAAAFVPFGYRRQVPD
ncbi:hypothetical protein ABZ297_06200 [Nonomuraea sp. NPDC005983]|uniref:hypothetical protein n=1 Tax=Nonomuraea sp. NPDC005983 TaxID=3155595 RepID=UPI0033B37E4B